MKDLRIVITGGHHTPALAVIRALRSELEGKANPKFFWIGHKYSMWGDNHVSSEYQEVTNLGIPFYNLKAGKFHQTYHLKKIVRIPFGFIESLYYLLKIKPLLIISFGGYLAVPVLFVSRFLKIPVVTHEQTTAAGVGNLFIARFAKRIYLGFKTADKYFPQGKTLFTGNPLRTEIFADRGLYRFNKGKKTLYFTGGKQGAHVINKFVSENLLRLVSGYHVIHQSGSSTVYNDYQLLNSQKSKLPDHLRGSYVIKDFFGAEELGSVYSRADVVISRAGANVVYELGALGKVAILVPIPWASRNEQLKNAEYLRIGGGAVILNERELSPERFFSSLEEVISNLEERRRRAIDYRSHFRRDAAKIIAQDIISMICHP